MLSGLFSRGFSAATDRGRSGEERAADFLRRTRGFHIVTRNWRNPQDQREEIDLVARDGEALVFIEVKARAAGALVPGYFAVTRRKRRVLRRVCRTYLRLLRHRPRTYRFDVVEVELSAGEPIIRHFENVPLF